MVRASIAAEKTGLPSVSIVARGFVQQAKVVAQALGVRNLAIAEYPGVVMSDSKETLRKKVEESVVPQILKGLSTSVEAAAPPDEPRPRDIVFSGTLEEVHEFFIKNLWTDGLPIIPPTIGKVERFLSFTDRSPDQVIGVLPPENRQATVWNVAVNGVMAGCRPEYMPILIAIVEAIAEPGFRLQDAGSTPGWEPLVIVNGPIVKELDFNYGSGVMRVGRQANTSIGRFLRLYMRNVPGLRIPPGGSDKGSIGHTFHVALAENEDAVAEIGWQPFSVDRGFERGENVVTVQSVVNPSPSIYCAGDRAEEYVQTIAEAWGQGDVAYWSCTGMVYGKWYPLLVMSPSIASAIASHGWSKDDIRKYLYEHVKVPARLVDKYIREAGGSNHSIRQLVEDGLLSSEYAQSEDPDRLVRVFLRPEWIGIVVAGDPDRNQAKGYLQNHEQGPPTSKRVELPKKWTQLRREARS